ncbi:metal-sensitive transcriptional regulator [Tenuibacillus multivorans]|uniref:DNA-binding transcriptional regulator, FrmR family n=1 Tax=Tenuibacillus multivorans TaxID=237069 RepID=A0A1H0B0L8_9BACI|nr:metal-sensitive transcriptional regulator [Tenuibacillus multivorans]GEL77580.1 transcriptional regulator [Tenuibacillus multivorans]SDN39200.1 DNA-binding transcriptional regulator, FrmR family [Tenuibacillus multivorans]
MNDKDVKVVNQDEPVVPRTNSEKERVSNRLKRIEGQVRGLQKMIEEDRYCVDVLVQISAVKAALDKVGYQMLERHAKMCVTNAVKEGNGEEYMDELMKVINQYSK